MPSASASAASRRRRLAEDEESEEEVQHTQRRRRAPTDDSEDEEEDDNSESMIDADSNDGDDQIVRRFVRFVLACEYQRTPIRRAAVLEKVFLKRRVPWKRIFDITQAQLRAKFGMELVELPMREKITMKEKRAAQKAKGGSKTSSAYILTSILPAAYRTPIIMPPSIIGSTSEEAEYVGLCTMLVSLIAMSPSHSMPNAKFESVLSRLNCDKNMGNLDSTQNVVAKMIKQGYIYKSVDRSGDDEQIDWTVGPRGKVEIGDKGIMGLVHEVYGESAPDNLEKRLKQSLGIEVVKRQAEEAESDGDPGPSTQRRRTGR